jgi:hypothetical protein
MMSEGTMLGRGVHVTRSDSLTKQTYGVSPP